MGAGNRSQGKLYWRKAVEYKLANKAKDNVIGNIVSKVFQYQEF